MGVATWGVSIKQLMYLIEYKDRYIIQVIVERGIRGRGTEIYQENR